VHFFAAYIERMGSVKFVSNEKKSFPFFEYPRTSLSVDMNIRSFIAPEKKVKAELYPMVFPVRRLCF